MEQLKISADIRQLIGARSWGTEFRVMPVRIPKINGPCGNPLVEYGALYGRRNVAANFKPPSARPFSPSFI